MKKVITLILVVSFLFVIFCSCGNEANISMQTTVSTDVCENAETLHEQAVTQEHINFILNRRVFLPDMSDLYRVAIADYDNIFDMDMTFGDLINDTYFIDELSTWKYLSSEDDATMVTFSGMVKSVSGEVPIVVGFAWTDEMNTPMVGHFIFGKDSNGNYNEWSIETIETKYGKDTETAMLMCDATFSCMLASSLFIEVVDDTVQEQETQNEITIDNAESNTYNTSNETSTNEKHTSMTMDEYYFQATEAYKELIQDFKVANYQDVRHKLLLCDGYKDSEIMLSVIDTIYTSSQDMSEVSGYEANLYDMSYSVNENDIYIFKEDFMGNGYGHLVLNTDVLQKTFTATISHVFATNMKNFGEVNVIVALVRLFTDINDTANLKMQLENDSSWKVRGGKEIFFTYYDGYNILIQVKEEEWGYVDCEISVNK